MSAKEGTFIQWKGTDVCIDLYCSCGYGGHFDGYFLYAWRCPRCSTVWVMDQDLPMHVADTTELDEMRDVIQVPE